jgi:hypothetical protein
MWMLPNGQIVNRPKGVTIDNVIHPVDIFYKWSKEDLAKIGIKPFREVKFDGSNYASIGFDDNEVNGEIVRTHDLQPKQTINQLKKQFGEELKLVGKENLLKARQELDYLQVFDSTSPNIGVWSQYITDLKTAWQTIKAEVLAISNYDVLVLYIREGWQKYLPSAPEEI